MAIQTLYYNIITPIENIKRILTQDNAKDIISEVSRVSKFVWYDDYLFVQRTMSPFDNETIVNFWQKKGLVPIEKRNGKKYWKDFCIVAYPDSDPTLPCGWVEIFNIDNSFNDFYVKMKGKPKGEMIKIGDGHDPKDFFRMLLNN